MKRVQCVCLRIGYILDYESPRKHASSIVRSESFAMKTDIPMNGSMVKNHLSLKTGTENFVPIVVPGLSSSSSSSSHPSTSMTPSRQERHCSTSSSSSSSSPTTATSRDSETREREDRNENDSSPVPVSSVNVDDRTETRCLPPQVAQVLKSQSGCKNSKKIWWMVKFLNTETHTPEPTSKRCEDLGKHNVYTHFPNVENVNSSVESILSLQELCRFTTDFR